MTQHTNRLVAIVDEYLAQQRAGRTPSRDDLFERHPELAPELEECLKSLELVERGLVGPRDDTAPGDPLDGILGDFRIIREIGRGGMGVVYEAKQISLGRRVALKVLPLAAVFDERHLQRFRNEAQAAASLHHGHIVPVHAVGQERGVHYYAMQYIEGRTLAQIIEELRAAECGDPATPDTSSQALSALTEERSSRTAAWCRAVARLGIRAAEALDHAHERGVVHRDVKPGNLMVDGQGHTWITDFGLATFERNTGLTMTGDLIGTVRYMSPEQALAKRVPVDHRTDIYSLGVTLYEVLTLHPAFPGEEVHSVIQDIAFHEPTAPRRLNSHIPSELETILLKAMAKDPGQRYETAGELAKDLDRFLRGEPIAARRPSMATRGFKWLQRHRGVAASGLFCLVAGTIALAVATYRVSQEERETRAALSRANTSLHFAQRAVGKFLTEIGVSGIKDERLPSPARQALLEDALGFYETVLKVYEPLFKDRDLVVTHVNRGHILHALHRYEETLAAYDAALEVDPGSAELLGQRAHQLWHLGRLEEALRICDRLVERGLGDALVHTVRALVFLTLGRTQESLAACDRALEVDPDLAAAHISRGGAFLELGRPEEALKAFDRALGIDPDLAGAHTGRGNALRALGRFEEALEAYDRALEIDPDGGKAHHNRGAALLDLGRPEEALEALDRVLELQELDPLAHTGRGNALSALGRHEEALKAHDRALELDPDGGNAHSNRGNALSALGRPEEALKATDRALELDPDLGAAHTNRGNALSALGRHEEALKAHDRALELDPGCAVAHTGRGIALSHLGRPEEALKAYDRALELDPGDAAAHTGRGHALSALGRPEEALKATDRALELDPNGGKAHSNRGNFLSALGRPEEALMAYDRALELDPGDAAAHTNRGNALSALGRHEEALEAFDRVLELDPGDAAAHINRGAALSVLSRPEEALKACDRVLELDPDAAAAHTNRGNALLDLGRHEEALEALDRALEIDPGEAKAHNNRGNALSGLGQREEALKAFDRALVLDPKYAKAHFNRGRTLSALGRHEEALEAFDRVLECGVKSPSLMNGVAWFRATSPEPNLRDAARAVALAQEATELAPKEGAIWNTLGVALCGTGKWREAIPALKKSMQLRSGGDAFDWFFVAMAKQKLGQKDAREWYDKAVIWMEKQSPDDEELNRFRAEAEEVLGINDGE